MLVKREKTENCGRFDEGASSDRRRCICCDSVLSGEGDVALTTKQLRLRWQTAMLLQFSLDWMIKQNRCAMNIINVCLY